MARKRKRKKLSSETMTLVPIKMKWVQAYTSAKRLIEIVTRLVQRYRGRV